MIQKKIALLLLITLIAATLLPGCWNRREPENLGLVLAVAFDFDQARELYQIIVQIADPVAMGEEEAGGGGESPFWVISAFGQTPFEAMKNLGASSSRELFWAHSNVLLLSERLARRGIGDILDLFERERQLRLTTKTAIVEGDMRKLMEADYPLEETGARGLDRQMVTVQFESAIFKDQVLLEVYNILPQPGLELFGGKIEVLLDEGQGEEAGGADDNGDDTNDPEMSDPIQQAPARTAGGVLFKGERMLGWATVEQTQGWMLAMGRGGRFVFVIECPGHPGEFLSVEVFTHKGSITPVPAGDAIRIEVLVEAQGRIQDFGCSGGDLSEDGEYTRTLRQRSAQVVRNRIEDMISRAQELNTDVLGFGNALWRSDPQRWRQVEERWDELFPDLVVNVEVEFNLVRSGLINRPLPRN